MNSQNYRLQVWYSGRVQGVGFRWKAAETAKGYDVCGYVENLDDGRVHLLAVGDESQTRRFADEIAEVMADFIKSADERDDSTDVSYRGFKIKL